MARRHDVCTSLIYKWGRDAVPRAPVAFIPVRLVEASDARDDRTRDGVVDALIVIELCR